MIKTSVNKHIINKTSDYKTFNEKFQCLDLTPKQLLDQLLLGHAICVAALKENKQGNCNRITSNFISGQVIGIDIDNTDNKKQRLSDDGGYVSYHDILKDDQIIQKSSFVYTTASHTDDHNRFRIIFALKNRIDDPEEFKKLIKKLTYDYFGDKATTSIVQGFYGSTNAKYEFFGNLLDDEDVTELLLGADELFVDDNQPTNECIVMNKIKYDNKVFTSHDIDEIVRCIFKNGNVDNHIWWKVPTILKAACNIPDKDIVDLIGKYVTDTGDIWKKLQHAKDYCNDMSIGTLIYYAKLNGYEIPAKLFGDIKEIKFWNVETKKQKSGNDKIRIHLNYTLFNKLICNHGFYIIKQLRGSQLIKIDDNNHIQEISMNDIKEFVFDYLQTNNNLYGSSSEQFLVEEHIRKTSDRFFNLTISNMIDSKAYLEDNLVTDTKHETFLFYKNGFRKITKDKLEFLPYHDLPGFIWKKSVNDRSFQIPDDTVSEYQRFIECVCMPNKFDKHDINESKFTSLKNTIGYLISKFKNKTETIAIVLTDEIISDDSEGRTGKSLFNLALGQMRNMTLIDGKNFDVTSPFHFSRVDISTEIINIDDCTRKFDFEKLYHAITGDITVERKKQNMFVIPFAKAPKLCFSTNNIFKGKGASHNSRIFEIEFSSYFNIKYTPEDEFHHQLFDDWNDAEWNRFDEFMARCTQQYLMNGLVRYEQININQKRLIENTSIELADYLNKFIEPETIYRIDDVLDDYMEVQQCTCSQTKLSQALKYWIEKYKNGHYLVELNRRLSTNIFVYTQYSKHDMKTFKRIEQFTTLKNGARTKPSKMNSTTHDNQEVDGNTMIDSTPHKIIHENGTDFIMCDGGKLAIGPDSGRRR